MPEKSNADQQTAGKALANSGEGKKLAMIPILVAGKNPNYNFQFNFNEKNKDLLAVAGCGFAPIRKLGR